jgi:hypothetical protein
VFSESNRLRTIRRRKSGIGRVVVALVFFILIVVGVALFVYAYESNAGRPKAAVILGSSTEDCSQVSFHVQNQDTRILRGWSVVPVITPTDPHIQTSPSSFPIEALGPRGNSTQYMFEVSLSGAPTGIYQLRLELVNGSTPIAISSSISCKV